MRARRDRKGLHGLLTAILLTSASGCSQRPSDSDPATAPSTTASDAPPTAPAAPEGQEGGDVVALCEHGVPTDLCTRCDPDLAAVFQELGDWCEPHQLPLSHCRIHDPELSFETQAPPADWCQEHGVPESMCTKCHPELVGRFIAAGDFCREHGLPLSVCPIHHPEQVTEAGASLPVFPPPDLRVRLASPQTVREAGIHTARVERRPFGPTLEVVGQLAFDQNRLAQITSRGEARILDVRVDVGDPVETGTHLATVASASVGASQGALAAAQARLGAAQAAVQRQEALVAKGIAARRSLEAAQATLEEAQAELRAARAGLSAVGAAPSGTAGQVRLTAPFAGTVVTRDAVIGRSVPADRVLFEIADLSRVWALLELPEARASAVQPGQPVTLTLEGQDTSLEASITRVSASVTPGSRTVRARVELPNPGARLKAGTFLRARISLAPPHDALLLPRDAIQSAEGRSVVFIQQGPTLFRPVAVTLGAQDGPWVEVLQGLEEGAEIVTTGAFLLKTEILKGSIGAGCCEEGG